MADIVAGNDKHLEKIRFYKHMLDRLAYASLIADVSIAIVTLVSLYVYSYNIDSILKWLDDGLTFIVIMTILVFILFAFVSDYHKKIVHMISNTGKRAARSVSKHDK